MSRPRALILTHGLSRATLAAARALDAGGWDVGIGSHLERPLSWPALRHGALLARRGIRRAAV